MLEVVLPGSSAIAAAVARVQAPPPTLVTTGPLRRKAW
jgi:hypothetical protein